nr:uncharacterized protein LOC126543163 [Dermacentor andersoni]
MQPAYIYERREVFFTAHLVIAYYSIGAVFYLATLVNFCNAGNTASVPPPRVVRENWTNLAEALEKFLQQAYRDPANRIEMLTLLETGAVSEYMCKSDFMEGPYAPNMSFDRYYVDKNDRTVKRATVNVTLKFDGKNNISEMHIEDKEHRVWHRIEKLTYMDKPALCGVFKVKPYASNELHPSCDMRMLRTRRDYIVVDKECLEAFADICNKYESLRVHPQNGTCIDIRECNLTKAMEHLERGEKLTSICDTPLPEPIYVG